MRHWIRNLQGLWWGSGMIGNILPWQWAKSTKYRIQNTEYIAMLVGWISKIQNTKYGIYCHGGGVNLQNREHMGWALGCINQIQNTEWIAMALGWIYKIQNIWAGRWDVSAIHVMSKLNRSHSNTHSWSVTLIICWYCFANLSMIKKRISLQKSLFTKEFKFTHFRIHSELHKNIFIVHLSIYALLSKSKIDPFYHRQSYFPLSLYMLIFTFHFFAQQKYSYKVTPPQYFLSLSLFIFTFHFHFPHNTNAHTVD